MKRLFLSFLAVTAFTFYGCDSTKNNQEEQTDASGAEATDTTSEATISLVPVTGFPEYNDAMLEMNEPTDGANLTADSIAFSYTAKNFELGAQTENNTMNLANSAKGQHIHVIFNNEPYHAHYGSEFKTHLEDGHYVVLSFLSRSYHMSVKNPEAYVLRQFTVGDADTSEDIDLSAQHLFYSRPKGEYSGADTENLLLDFYLVNTELSENGNKVRATINGQEFMITEWQPYAIQGLPMGEVTIKLELLDADGNLIEGPYNSVERTVTLSE